MTNTVKIKRSTSAASPATLENGELAYSAEVSHGGKLFIGRPGGAVGDVDAIGGKYYVDRSETAYGWGDHSAVGYLIATSAELSAKVAKAGDTMTGALNFGDGVYAQFGASQDLKIGHSGATSYIQDVGTGNLFISTNGASINLRGGNDNNDMAVFTSNGGVQLNYAGAPRFSAGLNANTSNVDLDVTGVVSATGGNSTNWNTAYGWGNHADEGYLTVPYSLPEATSTVRGGIELFSDTDQTVAANAVSATAGRTYGIQLNAAGQAVVNVPWTVYTHPAHAGDDIDLDTGPLTGATVISDLDFNVTTDTSGHVTDANATYSTRNITAVDVGALPIGGGTLTGALTTDDIVVPASKRLKFGTSATPNFEIYAGGTGTVLHEQGAGNIEFIGDNMIFRNPNAGTDIDFYAKFTYNGAAELYFDGTKTFETTTAGAKVTGDLQVDGNFTVNGTITTVNTEEVTIADNNIRLNGNFLTGIPTENAGISVRRGGYADVVLQWNEGTDKWEVTTDGSVYSNLLTAANFTTEFTGTIDGGTF
jgi:hypothetical protein